MFIVPAVILGVAVLVWLAYEAYIRLVGRRAALLAAVQTDPADFVRARLAEEAPHQFALNRRVEGAQAALTGSQLKVTSLGKDLPADPPPRKWVIVVLAFAVLWLVAFCVQLLLDYRIAEAVTGNVGSAALTSMVLSGLLSATSLATALLWEHRAALSSRQLRSGLLGAAALFCVVLSIVVALAPKRADLDFAGRIDSAKQSIAKFEEDGDATAKALQEISLVRLEEQRREAGTFYQAAAVTAGLLEGGSSLAVPSAFLLLSYFAAQTQVRRRAAAVTKAQSRVARRRERFAARMSRLLERAGVTQDRLGPLLTGAGGQAQHGPSPEINRSPGRLPPAPPRRPSGPPQDGAPEGGPRRPSPDAGLDPSFDQA